MVLVNLQFILLKLSGIYCDIFFNIFVKSFKMKKIIIFFFLFLGVLVFSQEIKTGAETKKDTIFVGTNVISPAFPGGIIEFINIIHKDFDTKRIKGTGIISSEIEFTVGKDGKISDVTATGPNSSFNREAILTIKGIKRKWKPATLNGVPVEQKFRTKFTAEVGWEVNQRF